MISLEWPWVLAALPVPWLVWRWVPPAPQRQPGGALRVPFYGEVAEQLGASGDRGRERRRVLTLAILAWTLLVVAAARPQWLGDPLNLPMSGRDLLLAVDISGSMELPDFDMDGRHVTRLDVVKAVAGRFIARRRGDRVGLILFGTRAYLQTPLTFDRATVQSMLDEAEIGLAGKETAIGDAIGLAVKRLRQGARDGNRVLVLLTDGANTAGEVAPRQAAALAAQEGLKIYTIGIGADRVRINTLFGPRVVNPSADLDEATLKAIAEATGGAFFRARDTQALESIYQRLDALEPSVRDARVYRPVAALFVWPLVAALLISVWLAARRLPVTAARRGLVAGRVAPAKADG